MYVLMCTCIPTYLHTYMHTYIHAYIATYGQPDRNSETLSCFEGRCCVLTSRAVSYRKDLKTHVEVAQGPGIRVQV